MTTTNEASGSDNKDTSDEVYSDTSSSSSDSPSYEILYSAYVEMHEELKKLAKVSNERKRIILLNQQKINQLQKELDELKLENETLDLIFSCIHAIAQKLIYVKYYL
ncbi:hypothetical protein TanjilG_25777 [Lupinus angustifolius]|uniref:Uncharacterized protein n=1 Tax=Lupinus angustifolius TaxID=3871 RepID=A0A394DLF5_LUPAN|nr:hypothetical protein TanjilG_25777 [Lupinus angustifolius]